jgi:hypothetical protein
VWVLPDLVHVDARLNGDCAAAVIRDVHGVPDVDNGQDGSAPALVIYAKYAHSNTTRSAASTVDQSPHKPSGAHHVPIMRRHHTHRVSSPHSHFAWLKLGWLLVTMTLYPPDVLRYAKSHKVHFVATILPQLLLHLAHGLIPQVRVSETTQAQRTIILDGRAEGEDEPVPVGGGSTSGGVGGGHEGPNGAVPIDNALHDVPPWGLPSIILACGSCGGRGVVTQAAFSLRGRVRHGRVLPCQRLAVSSAYPTVHHKGSSTASTPRLVRVAPSGLEA